jgi:hypothetical protein
MPLMLKIRKDSIWPNTWRSRTIKQLTMIQPPLLDGFPPI